jgi:hypothetical protein
MPSAHLQNQSQPPHHTLDFAVPEQADHVRFIVRASGHLGSFEMPASEIRKPR